MTNKAMPTGGMAKLSVTVFMPYLLCDEGL